MHLNIKDDDTVALVTEVALRTGTSKTGAVRELARRRLAELDRTDDVEFQERRRHAIEWLERDVWPFTTGPAPTKEQQEELLGLNDSPWSSTRDP